MQRPRVRYSRLISSKLIFMGKKELVYRDKVLRCTYEICGLLEIKKNMARECTVNVVLHLPSCYLLKRGNVLGTSLTCVTSTSLQQSWGRVLCCDLQMKFRVTLTFLGLY